jgi:hypothetical protein
VSLYAAICRNPAHLDANGQPFVTTAQSNEAKPAEMGPDCIVLFEELVP